MVRVYLAKLPRLGAAGGSGQKRRGQKERHEEQSAMARRLLMLALEREYPEFQGSFEVEKDERGKPFLRGHEHIHISLSHSGALTACAIADSPVGVDVEQRKDRPGQERIARRLHEEEQRWLAARSSEERQRAFYDLWVRKESFMKAVGEGLRLPLNSFCTVEADGLDGGCAVRVKQSVRGETYFLRQYELEGGDYSLAVCAQAMEFAPEPAWISL